MHSLGVSSFYAASISGEVGVSVLHAGSGGVLSSSLSSPRSGRFSSSLLDSTMQVRHSLMCLKQYILIPWGHWPWGTYLSAMC